MLLLVAALAVSALVLGAVGAASALLLRGLWRGSAHLAPVAGMLGIGVAGLAVFLATWAHPIAGIVVALALVGGSLVVLVVQRAWRELPAAGPWLLVGLGVLAIDVALPGLRVTSAHDWTLVTEFMAGLTATPDNQLPLLVAQRLADGESTHHVLENWNGSDRPPLLTGLMLLVAGVVAPVVPPVPAILGLATGMLAQLLWLPALLAFLRALGSSRRATMLTVVFVAVTGSTITNTVYSWPKMLSAALVLAAGALLVDAIRRPERLPSRLVGAVALAVLGVLSHGAALFTLPFLVALALVAMRGARPARVLATAGVAIGAAAVLWVPWMLYQRLADPPGDRLLKWHLAGVIDEDPRPFLEALLDSYRALTPGQWLAGRLENLAVAFDPTPLRVPWCLCSDVIADRRQVEFFTTLGSLGLALPVLLAVLVAIALRGIRGRPLEHADRVVLALVAISAACIVFWSLLMFLPGTTSAHQGSHLWVLLLTAAGVAWLARRRPKVVVGLILVQGAATLVLYGPGLTGVAPAGVAALVIGIALLVLALRIVQRPLRRVVARR